MPPSRQVGVMLRPPQQDPAMTPLADDAHVLGALLVEEVEAEVDGVATTMPEEAEWAPDMCSSVTVDMTA